MTHSCYSMKDDCKHQLTFHTTPAVENCTRGAIFTQRCHRYRVALGTSLHLGSDIKTPSSEVIVSPGSWTGMFLRSFICEEDFSVTTVIGSSQSVVA